MDLGAHKRWMEEDSSEEANQHRRSRGRIPKGRYLPAACPVRNAFPRIKEKGGLDEDNLFYEFS